MARWLRGDKEDDKPDSAASAQADLRSIEIKPEIISDAMKPHLDSFRTEMASTMDEKLKSVNEFFANQNREREAAARKVQQDNDNVDDVDFINDPTSAIDRKLAPLIRNQQAANAMLMINETLGEMDYYRSDPEFKAKVLSKINSQPLGLRANADIIMNCYKLVAYDERKAIEEGKYRSIMGAASTSGSGSHTGSGKSESEVTISDEEKHYAKKLGISEADWVKSKKTLEYV